MNIVITLFFILQSFEALMGYSYDSDVQGYRKHLRRDCPGNDISSFTVSSPVPSKCSEECDSVHNCVAIAIKRYTTTSTNCWLKRKCPSKSYKYNINVYERIHIPGCTFLEVKDYVLYGQNKKTIFESSKDYCKQECLNNIDWCKSADYINAKKTCFLSSENRETYPTRYGKYTGSVYLHRVCGTDVDNWAPTGPFQNSSKPELIHEGSQCYMKYGPFGGHGGSPFSDHDMVASGRITALQFTTNGALVCLAVTYGSIKTQCRGGSDGVESASVSLDPDEYITGVTGHRGHSQGNPVVSQLSFLTNKRTIGPYGSVTGTPFSVNAGGKRLAFIAGQKGGRLDILNLYFHC